ncbi:MAG: hypothetical protein NZ555_16915 [Geminicoccaceae bacterium]|nr:hypothetical protein [Geminicoccaceae bacterium]MDW8371815.1 hypothetical protein [Geminicoccaceae bacterium]
MRRGSLLAGVVVAFALAVFPQRIEAQAIPLPERITGDSRISDRDRERARLACRREAQRQNFAVQGVTPPREVDGGRLRLRMDLERRDRRWLGTCTYDTRRRSAELEARRVDQDRPQRPGRPDEDRPGRPGGSASAGQVRDACIREVTQNARTQLVAAGKVERRSGGASVMPMTIRVEGTERRVRCFYDNATGAVTIR